MVGVTDNSVILKWTDFLGVFMFSVDFKLDFEGILNINALLMADGEIETFSKESSSSLWSCSLQKKTTFKENLDQ